MELFKKTGIQRDVEIDSPEGAVYQIYKKTGKKDMMSLGNNPTAERWTRGITKIPAGLEREIAIFSK